MTSSLTQRTKFTVYLISYFYALLARHAINIETTKICWASRSWLSVTGNCDLKMWVIFGHICWTRSVQHVVAAWRKTSCREIPCVCSHLFIYDRYIYHIWLIKNWCMFDIRNLPDAKAGWWVGGQDRLRWKPREDEFPNVPLSCSPAGRCPRGDQPQLQTDVQRTWVELFLMQAIFF